MSPVHQRTYFGMAVTFPVNFGMKAAIRLSVRSSPYHLLEMADTSGPSEVSWAPNGTITIYLILPGIPITAVPTL